MMNGLKRLLTEGLLLREVEGLRSDLTLLTQSVTRIAAALELQNAHAFPSFIQATPETPAVEVSYVDEQVQAEIMDIELRLTRATGQPPTEEEIEQEFHLRHRGQDQPA